MKLKNIIKILLLLLLFPITIFGGPPPPPERGLPIDGGLIFLSISVIALGVLKNKKFSDKDKTL